MFMVKGGARMEAKSVNIRKLSNRSVITVTLNITREFRIRIFIAKVLLKVACVVLGCGIKINDGGKNES